MDDFIQRPYCDNALWRALHSAQKSALPQVSVACPGTMARRPSGRSAADTVLPRRFHGPGRDCGDRVAEQGSGLRHSVLEPPPKQCRSSLLIRNTAALASASSRSSIRGPESDGPSAPALRGLGWRSVPDQSRWVACRPGLFLPVRVLSRLFRRLFLERLHRAFDTGRLQFFNAFASLQDVRTFARHLAGPRRTE
jgi:hypothetical protein